MVDQDLLKTLHLTPRQPLILKTPKLVPNTTKFNLTHTTTDSITIPKFQEICEFFGLPLYEPEISANFDTLLVYLTNLAIEYKNFGIVLPDAGEFRKTNMLWTQLREMDSEADRLEVKIANLDDMVRKTSYERYHLLCNELELIKRQNEWSERVGGFRAYLEDLAVRLETQVRENNCCAQSCDIKQFSHNDSCGHLRSNNENITSIILSNLDVRLYYLRSYKKYKNYIAKGKILRNINANKSPEGLIISSLLKHRVCDVNQLQELSGVDRVEFLKIIYKLSYKGIVNYTAESNTVSLNYESC